METTWRTVIFCLITLVFAAASTSAFAGQHNQKIFVEAAWSRATPPTAKIGAVYLTLKSAGSKKDRLIDGKTPVAKHVEIHEMGMRDGVGFMRKLDGLEISVSGAVTFEPGGLHLMLIGLTGRLVEGQTYPLELNFEKAGTVKVVVTVKNIAARAHKAVQSLKPHTKHSR